MRYVLLAVSFCFVAAARAEDTWTLTTADFARATVTLRGMSASGVDVTENGSDKTVALDRVLRLDRDTKPPTAAAKYVLYLQGGDRMAGEPGDLKDEVLTWKSPAVGELKLPLSKLLAISRLPSVSGLDDERKEDAVVLSNRDVVRGVVAGIEEGKILVQSNNDTVPVPFSSADTILFAGAAAKRGAAERAFRVRLVDGSIFTSPHLKIDAGKLTLDLPAAGGKTEPRQADLLNVVAIEQINGPVAWLSDRTPTVNQQVPFNSETTYPAKMDRNVFGKPLRFGGQTFEKGIGAHANSVLTFPLDPAGGYRFFRTRYAIDAGSGDAGRADVNVRILADRKVVYEQKDVRAFKLSPVVTVDVSGAKTLTLEVSAAGVTDTQDRLDWLEAALVKEAAPAEEPTADNHPQTAPATAPGGTTRPASQP
jgi:hypothetical protein